MMELTPIVAAGVSVLGALVTAAIGIATNRVRASKEVANLYDQMVRFRAEHPEVLRLSRSWSDGGFLMMYRQVTQEDQAAALYCCYGEFCIGYCNAVLSSRRWLTSKHHLPLVKLVLTENAPLVIELIREGKYISHLIQDHWRQEEKRGWNWILEHEQLVTLSVDPTHRETE